jgi:hypothetical protein
MLPPELHEPFASSQERTLVVRELLDLCGDIDELQQLAARPVNQWPLGQLHRFAAPMASRAEDPARWLAQWRTCSPTNWRRSTPRVTRLSTGRSPMPSCEPRAIWRDSCSAGHTGMLRDRPMPTWRLRGAMPQGFPFRARAGNRWGAATMAAGCQRWTTCPPTLGLALGPAAHGRARRGSGRREPARRSQAGGRFRPGRS